MPLAHLHERLRDRGVIATIIILNVTLAPLYANMILLLSSSWAPGRTHSFQLTGIVLLVVSTLLRWRPMVGLVVNVGILMVAAIMLFWSPEPLTYILYTAYLLLGGVVLYGLIFVLTRSNAEK